MSAVQADDIAAWIAAAEEEYNGVFQQCDPVYNRFTVSYFVSDSKGKGRRRKHPKEVILVRDDWNADYRNRWQTLEKLPLDEIATEVYGFDELGLDDRLRRELLTNAKRT